MIHEKISGLLNTQINKEFFSAYLYLDFAAYYTSVGLNGFANWYHVQAKEEQDHALLFLQYMQNNNLEVTLEAIEKPGVGYSSSMAPLTYAFEHEQYVTSLIHNLYDEAYSVKDFRTMQFLDWFIKEQGEEEAKSNDLIRKMELFGSESKSLYMLDQELATRMYAPPTLVL